MNCRFIAGDNFLLTSEKIHRPIEIFYNFLIFWKFRTFSLNNIIKNFIFGQNDVWGVSFGSLVFTLKFWKNSVNWIVSYKAFRPHIFVFFLTFVCKQAIREKKRNWFDIGATRSVSFHYSANQLSPSKSKLWKRSLYFLNYYKLDFSNRKIVNLLF